jgi:hypothetical protein
MSSGRGSGGGGGAEKKSEPELLDTDGRLMHIDRAPYRIRREHYRRERIMSTIAILVILSVVGAIGYVIWRIFH